MTPDPRALLALALVLAVVLAARWRPPREGSDESGGAWLPVTAGCIAAGLTLWTWGGLRAPPVLHDEAAYVLQASLLARGTWALPPAPVPEAFTQAAVLVTPVLTPKMAPGHALVLLPGVLLGLPGLMPILLAGFSGALVVVLARRAASARVALLAFAFWLTQAGQMRWRSSYLSQSTTALLWLLGWWCLLRWRDNRAPRWLVLLAACAGLGAITRPLTMLAWAIPVAGVVLPPLLRERRFGQLLAAAGVGVLLLAVIPLQNYATLGDWRASPRALYTRQYMPWDVLGFGLDSTPPLLAVPDDLRRATAGFVDRHREHTVDRLPGILAARLDILRRQTVAQWRIVWVPAAVAGIVLLGAAGWFGVGTAALLYLGYLLYAHEPQWTAYYVEATPAVALVLATGLAGILERLAGRRRMALPVAALAAGAILVPSSPDFVTARLGRRGDQAPQRRLEQRVADAGDGRVLLFVTLDPEGDAHQVVVRNVADPGAAPIITAHDLGDSANARVSAAFPGRARFRYDQRLGTLTPLSAAP